ncbi:MAG: SAM-dependent methyltransferase [Pseudomonas sp.]|jgi:SAM-dependent methyltransferase|uniref:class I SAM-dependent methyltransferase n=1 Tax=Pseudomonas sp. TaxID=306 RepID=UPI002611AE23|nr:class I SAM-dependent methyltransferase [Pseudomonas sp.]MDB6049558.1 SAM-dependent methyltransferase [Pseudomonas sp.]
MTQNIYDNPRFYEGYSRLNRSVQGLDGAPEWPAIRALLPLVADKKVLDLGCGYGWFSRWAAEQGAASVLGLDVSTKMLAHAEASTQDSRIRYTLADLETLTVATASVDLAYSSLAFHYIKDLQSLLSAVHAALVPGGHLVFSIEHPIYMAPRQPGFIEDDQGRKSWPLDSYQHEGPRVTHWLSDGVVKQHRTLGTLLNMLIGTGFTVDHVNEWGPSDEDLKALPTLADERERPMMLIVAASR